MTMFENLVNKRGVNAVKEIKKALEDDTKDFMAVSYIDGHSHRDKDSLLWYKEKNLDYEGEVEDLLSDMDNKEGAPIGLWIGDKQDPSWQLFKEGLDAMSGMFDPY